MPENNKGKEQASTKGKADSNNTGDKKMVEKVNGETTVDGYLSKTEIENVFWDSENDK